MRALWIADRLREFGLTVTEHEGWKKRGKTGLRPAVVVCHHTAGSPKGDAPSLKLVIEGRKGLPGPLCHVLLSRSGVCHVIASGVANHAGPGGWMASTGNSTALGIEAEHTGKSTEMWPPAQLLAYHRACAALLSGIDKDERFVCGHKEWAPKRKIDPIGLDMDSFRRSVGALLGNQEDDMFTDPDRDRLARLEATVNKQADVLEKLRVGMQKRSIELDALLKYFGLTVEYPK